MDWQTGLVIAIVLACGYLAYREIKKELTGQSKCSGCSEAKKSQKPIQIGPPIKHK